MADKHHDDKAPPPPAPVPGGAAGPDDPKAVKAMPAEGARARAAAGRDGKAEVQRTARQKGPMPGTVEYEQQQAADEETEEVFFDEVEEPASAGPGDGAYLALGGLVLVDEEGNRRDVAGGAAFDATEDELSAFKVGRDYRENKRK